MLSVVNCESVGNKMVVTLEGDTFGEAQDIKAKDLAINYGRKYLGSCGIADISGPYPVDGEGKELFNAEDLTDLSQRVKDGGLKPAIKYRSDVTIQQFGF